MSEEIRIWTHSDDCAGIEGRREVDESEFWDVWWPLTVDGVKIGEINVDPDPPWMFRLRGVDGHVLDVDTDRRHLPPTDEDGYRL